MPAGTPPSSSSPSPPPPPRHSSSIHFDSSCSGSITPVLCWKALFHESLSEALPIADLSSPSARKLAASLWSLQQPPFSPPYPKQQASSPSPMSDKSTFPASKKKDASRKTTSVMHSSDGYDVDSGLSQSPLESGIKKKTVLAIEKFESGKPATIHGSPSPDEFLKVLGQLRSLEDQQSSSVSLVTALRMELEHAYCRAEELEFAQKSARKEIDNLLRSVTEDRMMVRSKEHQNAKATIESLRDEIKEQKKARRKLEALNRRLVRDISESNKALAKALDEVERVRKTRKLMEDVCHELAKEIGDDKAEVEQLKRWHAKAREEVDEERKMLQISEAWREEKVQMKLAQARFQLQEKNKALDVLKGELESFLDTHRTCGVEDNRLQEEEIREAEMLLCALNYLQLQDAEHASFPGPESDEAGTNNHPPVEFSEFTNGASLLNHRFNGKPERRGQWTIQRHVAASTSKGSRTPDFDDVHGESQLDDDSCRDDESRIESERDTNEGSEREYTSEPEEDERGGSDYSTYFDENSDEIHDCSPSDSVTEVEDDDDGHISSDFSQECDYRKRESQRKDKDGRCSQSVWKRNVDADELIKIPTKEGKFGIHIGSLKNFLTRNTRSAAAAPVQNYSNAGNYSDAGSSHLMEGLRGSLYFRSASSRAKLSQARMESQNARRRHAK